MLGASPRALRHLLGLIALAPLAGCTCGDTGLDGGSFFCTADDECAPGFVCDRARSVCAEGTDAGPPAADAGRDAGGGDSGTPDAGRGDAGPPDGGAVDSGTPDSGLPDAGAADGGPADAGASLCPDGGPDAIPDAVLVWKLDEGSGITAGDSSGNGNTGTLIGSVLPVWVGGRVGGGLFLQAPDAIVRAPSSSSLSAVTGPFTISFWLQTTGLNPIAQSYLVRLGLYPTVGWDFVDDGQYNDHVFFRMYPSSNQVLIHRPQVNDGVWHHLAGVYDGTSLFLYLDGVLAQTTTAGAYTPATSNNFAVGQFQAGDGGTVDLVRFYGRGLTPAEVQCLAAE